MEHFDLTHLESITKPLMRLDALTLYFILTVMSIEVPDCCAR